MNVVVFSKPHCLECNLVKRFLRDHGVEFEVKDCGSDPRYLEEVKAMGFLGVPVTVIDGTPVQGLQPEKLKELLYL
ncbi:ribonucleoside-diphosphate reductase class Ib glutaredoxin subunit [Melghirimyces profundicolus]|uniref:Ribonucleoside-diphosphate reductase class Ib glutaredoxin subunit n=1 Tax=Melghirimyces profundicolus TaxID=1242148 RepID=A0A2T6BSK3_9BACL|nr:glutaredoxin domain-containing protein [Melghirimyces profundicolus]PTX59068.1 ribonucleoside-diphosphate reductase class Ib glutaredoxin subunit [Melghirimyces profundicolus]